MKHFFGNGVLLVYWFKAGPSKTLVAMATERPIGLKWAKRCRKSFSAILFGSSLNLNATRPYKKSRTSSNFGQIRIHTSELCAFELRKKNPVWLYL